MKVRALAVVLLAGALAGCSIKRLAVNTLGSALASGGDVYAGDDDPELIAGAVPFGLKTVESLLAASPDNRDLLLAATSGFVQYSYAFVQCEADYIESQDFARATAQRARAKKLYLRALAYGRRGLEAAHPGFEAALRKDAAAALAKTTAADVPLLYWTGAAWGAAISSSKENAELAADLGLVEALMRRALQLDEGFGGGAIHDFFIAYDGGRPASAGGSREKAREHLSRALALAKGRRAAPFVSFAESVSVAAQDRKEFRELLEKALEVDPDAARDQRLANILAQRRARWLLSRVDELFLE